MALEDSLNNPKLALTRAQELINSTSGDEYDLDTIEPRNEDLSFLSAGALHAIAQLGLNDSTATVLKETITCAYLLGQRDAQPVPDAFTE